MADYRTGQLIKAAYNGMYADLKMIREKRPAMKTKPGERHHKAQ